MGFELANIHLGTARGRDAIRRDLEKRTRGWLTANARKAANATAQDYKDWLVDWRCLVVDPSRSWPPPRSRGCSWRAANRSGTDWSALPRWRTLPAFLGRAPLGCLWRESGLGRSELENCLPPVPWRPESRRSVLPWTKHAATAQGRLGSKPPVTPSAAAAALPTTADVVGNLVGFANVDASQLLGPSD